MTNQLFILLISLTATSFMASSLQADFFKDLNDDFKEFVKDVKDQTNTEKKDRKEIEDDLKQAWDETEEDRKKVEDELKRVRDSLKDEAKRAWDELDNHKEEDELNPTWDQYYHDKYSNR